MECFTLKLGNLKSCKKLEIKVNGVLASAAHILNLKQYKEDPCTRMNANSRTIPYFGELTVALCDHLAGWGIGGKFRGRGSMCTYGSFTLLYGRSNTLL